jgi:hypothetical protein
MAMKRCLFVSDVKISSQLAGSRLSRLASLGLGRKLSILQD